MAVFLGSRSANKVSRCDKARRESKRTLVNVGEDTTLGDGDVAEQLVQLLIVADGELEMTGDDTRLLVVAGSVASQLEDFGSQVLEDGGEVHGGTSTDTLSVVALAEQTVNTTDGERETGLGRAAGDCQSMASWNSKCRKQDGMERVVQGKDASDQNKTRVGAHGKRRT